VSMPQVEHVRRRLRRGWLHAAVPRLPARGHELHVWLTPPGGLGPWAATPATGKELRGNPLAQIRKMFRQSSPFDEVLQ
jgi:hypothetical protein